MESLFIALVCSGFVEGLLVLFAAAWVLEGVSRGLWRASPGFSQL